MPNAPEQSLTPSPRLSIGPLNTIAHVREEMARLYKQARRGEVPAADASRFAFILVGIAKLLAESAIEARLCALEQALDNEDFQLWKNANGNKPESTTH